MTIKSFVTRLAGNKLGVAIFVVAATVFLLAIGLIINYNIKQMVNVTYIGTNYVKSLGRTVQAAEGTSHPTKQGMINVYFGDGMRFVAFLSEHLPENATVVFPLDKLGGGWQPSKYFKYVGYNHFKPILYPRRMEHEVYDYQTLPYDPASLAEAQNEYQPATRQFSYNGQLLVLQAFVSPEAQRYRLYFIEVPLKNDSVNKVQNLFIAYPENVSP